MAFRTLSQTPPALRQRLLSLRNSINPTTAAAAAPALRALYHSYEHDSPPPYRDAESAILSSALSHVPAHGFTRDALTLGTREAGYPDISTNLIRHGAFEIARYHLVTERLALRDRVQFGREEGGGGGAGMSVGGKVRSLVRERLRANAEAGVVPRWHEALGLMSLAEHLPASLRELALLADEIWFLAGDVSVDASWYTKRAALSAVYAAAELFQTTDQSTEFRDTEEFVDRRLEEVRTVGGAVGGAVEWLGFQGGAMVNLLRSKGVRI